MTNQYNDNIPDLSNQVSTDIPDIEETFGFIKEVFYKIATENGWSNVSTANLRVWTPGMVCRPVFTFKDADEIYIGAGAYHLNGSTFGEGCVYWASQLTYQFTSLTDSTWSYLYIDDSDLASTNIITASELTDSTTAPTYSQTKKGWYNGQDRCIFAVYYASSSIYHFYHDGGDLVNYTASWSSPEGAITPGNTWTDMTLNCPSFCTKVLNLFQSRTADSTNNCVVRYRVNGDSSNGQYVIVSSTTDPNVYYTAIQPCYTDSSNKIEVSFSTATAGSGNIRCRSQGFYFPGDM